MKVTFESNVPISTIVEYSPVGQNFKEAVNATMPEMTGDSELTINYGESGKYVLDVKGDSFMTITATTIEGVEVDVYPSQVYMQGKVYVKVNAPMTKDDITGKIVRGENRLVIRGRKVNNVTGPNCHRRVNVGELPYKQTELEAVYILGDFRVEEQGRSGFAIRGGQVRPVTETRDLSKKGFPFYVGRFSACAEFQLKKAPKRITLEISGVHAPCLEVRINNRMAGVRLWPPYTLDIGRLVKQGKNRVEIIFPTDLYNLMGPNQKPLGLPAGYGPANFRDKKTWSPRLRILPKGFCRVCLGF